MTVLVKIVFARELTQEELDEARSELMPYIIAGNTSNTFPEDVQGNVSYREWDTEKNAKTAVERILTKPWCKTAGITSLKI
jgi:hypothetical protein